MHAVALLVRTQRLVLQRDLRSTYAGIALAGKAINAMFGCVTDLLIGTLAGRGTAGSSSAFLFVSTSGTHAITMSVREPVPCREKAVRSPDLTMFHCSSSFTENPVHHP